MSLSFLCNDLSKCSGINKDTATSFLLDDFADMSMEFVYVMDFLKRKFCYVPDNDFFLNGHSVEEVFSLSYDFYKLVIHKDDYPLALNIYKEILLRLRSMQKNEEIRYFSFFLRIRNGSDYVMIYNKIKPVFVSGKFRFGICMLSSSIASKAGDLRLYFKNSTEYEKYLPNENLWQKKKEQHLSKMIKI